MPGKYQYRAVGATLGPEITHFPERQLRAGKTQGIQLRHH
jgi:hypothetical protein